MPSNDHPKGIETRDIQSGFQGYAHHGDGTATVVWGSTEDEARQKAIDAVRDDE